MNSTRLYVLGALAGGGPMHGHQIRRAAQTDRTDLWTDIKPASMYGALHRMENEGVIRSIRTEQDGNRPARTVYEVTPAGLDELQVHRDEALREVRIRPDPVDLALQNTQGLTDDALLAVVRNRRGVLATQLASWRQLRDTATPHLRGFEHMTFRHTELRLEAELAWHDELLAELPAAAAVPGGEPHRPHDRVGG